jgi:hypothetical protein
MLAKPEVETLLRAAIAQAKSLPATDWGQTIMICLGHAAATQLHSPVIATSG